MAAIGQVVTLDDGSTGVVADAITGGLARVKFPDGTHTDVLDANITATLSAPEYQEGDQVTVWPDQGAIDSIDGSQVTVTLTKAERIPGVAHIEWMPDVTVPLWRIILDNDTRLQRAY